MGLKQTIGRESGRALLLGNEAIARGAIEAGIAVATAYPGTPSTEIVESLAEVANDLGIYVEWSVNEKVAFETAFAAATAGARSLTAMKHVGLNVAADPLFSSAYTGVEEGFVIVSADDPSMWSSQNEQDNRLYGLHAYIPVIEPTTLREVKDLTKQCFEFSKEIQHPVILRTTTRISHTRVVVELGPISKPIRRGKYFKDPERYVLVPSNARKLRAKLVEKWRSIEEKLSSFPFNAIEGDGKVLIVGAGISYSYVVEALEHLGIRDKVRVLKLSTVVPLPRDLVRKALEGVEKVLVVEELEPVVEMQLKSLVVDEGMSIEVHGKDLVGYLYEMSLTRAMRAVAKFMGIDYAEPSGIETTLPSFVFPRPPQLCPGCPYRPLYYALRKVVDRLNAERGVEHEPIFCGDIGCYTLGLNPPFRLHDTTIEMGGSLGMANGFAISVDDRIPIAIIGDSTFYHAGIPPLINAVYNSKPVLVIVLDNRITAMTGHQPNPSTGITATGREAKIVKIEDIARACGVEYVKVFDPANIEETEKILREAIEYVEKERKPALIVSRRLCALQAVRKIRSMGLEIPRYFVDPEKCVGCGLCYNKFACPAIRPRSREDRKATIDPELCTGCGVCASICPVGAIKPENPELVEKVREVWRG